MKKTVAILLILGILFSFAACGEPEYAHGSEKTVMKLGDHKVSEELYRYFLLNTMDEMADGDKTFFDGTDREEKIKELEQKTLDCLKEYYAVIDLAKKCKITLTDREKEALHAAMEGTKSSFEDDAAYKEALEKSYLSEYVAYCLYYNEELYGVLYDVMSQSGDYFSTKNGDILKYAKENFYFCRQFVVSTEDTKGDTEAKAKAEDIRQRLVAGENPADILKDYERDAKVAGAYYCFAESEDYLALDEAAVKKMKTGEISAIREDGYGFHIVMRLEADEEYLEENLTDTVFESYCMHQIKLKMKEISDGYKVEYKNKKSPERYR